VTLVFVPIESCHWFVCVVGKQRFQRFLIFPMHATENQAAISSTCESVDECGGTSLSAAPKRGNI